MGPKRMCPGRFFTSLLVLTLLTLPLATGGPPGAADDQHRVGSEGLEHLKTIVRLDTSNPPGNESRVTAYLAAELRKVGLEPQLFESVPGRGSLMVRYKGTGAKKPL